MKGPTQIVREWLKANPGHHAPAAICDALGVASGETARNPYYNALGQMARAGFASRTGSGRHGMAYGYLTEPPPPMTPEQQAAAARERGRSKHLARGGRTMEQRRAEEGARKAARDEAIAAARTARHVAREQKRAAKVQALQDRKAAREAEAAMRIRQMAAKLASDRLARVASRAALAPAKVGRAIPAETSADFEARGGHVERLPGFEQVKPYTVRPLGRSL